MSVNKSSNKIRVSALLESEGTLGLMDPVVNMRVRSGVSAYWIVGLTSGNNLVNLSLTSGGPVVQQQYPFWLTIDSGTASYFGWPYGINEPVHFGHSGVFPHGVPVISGTGVTYFDGTNMHTFGRA